MGQCSFHLVEDNHGLRGHSEPGRVILHPQPVQGRSCMFFLSQDKSPVGVHVNPWKIGRSQWKSWYVCLVRSEDLRVVLSWYVR